jgi:peptidylamidoglycolate lyase
MTDLEHGFERLTGAGVVVPNEERPSKSNRLYANKGITDGGGHLSPHMLPQPFLPVNGKGGEDLAGPYEVVEGWPQQIEEGWRLAGPSGAVVFSSDEVIITSHFGTVRDRLTPLVWGRNVFQMEGSPMRTYGHMEKKPERFVTTFDREGRLTDAWAKNDHLFGKVNRIFSDPADPERHLWISDSKRQCIFKFTRDGDLVMRIGEVEAHSVPENPWKAEDIAWLPNGDFYTVGLARVDRFNAAGELQASRLTAGDQPGEFSDLHGIVLDAERDRILVVDRGNSRIQVFDMDWNFREEWPNIYAPYAMRMQSDDGHIWVADGFTSKFLRYDLDGHLVASWGQWGIAPGCTWGVHWFDVDEAGDLYVLEVYGERVQKFRRRADVSPHDPRLIGALHRY